MNQTIMHIVILFISQAFTFNKLGHCHMGLQHYILKITKDSPYTGGYQVLLQNLIEEFLNGQ